MNRSWRCKAHCDAIGENNLFGKTNCTDYYAKVGNATKPKPIFSNITKEEKEALHNLRRDDSQIAHTADKGVVIIDKDMYIEKCMASLMMRKYTVNTETRPSPFIPRWIYNLYIYNIQLGQNSRINTSKFILQNTTVLLTDSMVYQKIHKVNIPFRSMYHYVAHPLINLLNS